MGRCAPLHLALCSPPAQGCVGSSRWAPRLPLGFTAPLCDDWFRMWVAAAPSHPFSRPPFPWLVSSRVLWVSHALFPWQAAGWAPPLLPSVQILDSLLEVPERAGKHPKGCFPFPHVQHMKWFRGRFMLGKIRGCHGLQCWEWGGCRPDLRHLN